MNVATPPIKLLAASYGITRQRIHQLRQRHGVPLAAFADPDRLFEHLLQSGRRSRLRSKLSDPATRENIAEEINLAAIRGPVPDVQSKIQSIK